MDQVGQAKANSANSTQAHIIINSVCHQTNLKQIILDLEQDITIL